MLWSGSVICDAGLYDWLVLIRNSDCNDVNICEHPLERERERNSGMGRKKERGKEEGWGGGGRESRMAERMFCCIYLSSSKVVGDKPSTNYYF